MYNDIMGIHALVSKHMILCYKRRLTLGVERKHQMIHSGLKV